MRDPTRFGVANFDENNNLISVEEKPKHPKSNIAITGLYFYDNNVINIAKNVQPSSRGELEITSINNEYIKNKKAKLKVFGRGVSWMDAGTHDSLLECSDYIRSLQAHQGLYIGCVEEVAYRMGFIGKERLLELANKYKNTDYGLYLHYIAEEVIR